MVDQPLPGRAKTFVSANSVVVALRKGLDHHRRNRTAEAELYYLQALRINARHPDALNLLGVLRLDKGDVNSAVGLLQKAAAGAPRSSAIQSNLGNALRAAGRPADAIARYTLAIQLDPQHAAAHYNLGQALRGLGRLDDALLSLRRAQQMSPQDRWAQALAETLIQRGDFQAADEALRAQLRRSPTWAGGYVLQGGVRVRQGRIEEGVLLLDRGIELDPKEPRHLAAKGAWLLSAQRVREAETVLRAALEIDAGEAQTWNDLGRALRAQGDLDGGRAAFLKAVELDAAHADARRNLALTQEEHSPSNLNELHRLIADARTTSTDKALAQFAAGKLLDDQAQFTEAFSRYERGNALLVPSERNVEAAERHAADRAAAALDAARVCPATDGLDDLTPVFVVGMPRSGTSLVEQIIASHSQAFGAGELSWIVDYAHGRWNDADNAAAAASRYISQMKALAPDALRVTDKLPHNLLYLDMISELFLKPRIIICRRNPFDTILSCYFQIFSRGNEFAYDLRACARRWLLMDSLARAYINSPRVRVCEVWYESLVHDLGKEAPRLLSFIDLPWEEACLEFYKTKRVVATASGWQVRQPVYNKSAGRWRNYEPLLRAALGGSLFDELLVCASGAPLLAPA